MTEIHEPYLRKAIQLAELAVEHNNAPFGALLVCDGKVVLTAENTIFTESDATCHAELNLVKEAAQVFDVETLSRCTLYASTEPCAMCSAAIYWAGIPRVVFSCSTARLGEIRGVNLNLSSREVFARGKRQTEVIGPILEEEGLKIHLEYWKHQI